jgi:hypothetical protein
VTIRPMKGFLKFVRSASGAGIFVTVIYGLWMVWYFALSGGWNPLEGIARGIIGGPENFLRNFAILVPIYLTVEVMTSAYSLVSHGAAASGRFWGLVNIISTIAVLLEAVVLRVGAIGIDPQKIWQLDFCIYLSVCDIVITIGIAMLVSVGLRSIATSPPT